MSLTAARRLTQLLPRQLGVCSTRGFAVGSGDPLKGDTRTAKPQQDAHETDEATKDSIRHAAEGKPGEALGDIADMAKNAAKGAKDSAKLMADSVMGKGKEKAEAVKQDIQDKP